MNKSFLVLFFKKELLFFPYTVGRGQISGWGYTRRTGPWHCALDRIVIGNRACCVDIRYSHSWFVSDRLANLLKKHRLFGFDLGEYCAELDPD